MIKKYKTATLLAFVFPIVASQALAETITNNLAVTAHIPETCSFGTITNIDFGNYDLSQNSDTSGAIEVNCRAGSTYHIRLDNGKHSNRQMVLTRGSGTFLDYELYIDSARSTPWPSTNETINSYTSSGGAFTHQVYGRIPSGQDKPHGDYEDTVQISIEY